MERGAAPDPVGRCPDCGASLDPGDEVCRDCGLVLHSAPKGDALAVLANRLGWIVGLTYLLAALGLATGQPPATGSGVAFGVGGLYLLPPTRRALSDALGVRLRWWQVLVVAVAVFFVAWGLLPEQPPLIGGTEEYAL